MLLTNRDRAIIKAVHNYRIMRRDQIQTLFFPSAGTCIRALARLYQNRYLDRVRPFIQWGTGDRPALYVLDHKGADLLRLEGQTVNWNPKNKQVSQLFLEHTIAVNNVRVAATSAAHHHDFALKWIPEHEFRSARDKVTYAETTGKKITRPIIPDGAMVITQPGYTARLLIEVDMATHDNPSFGREKVRPGLAYLRSEAYKKRFDYNSGRWLVITTSQQRLNNLKRQTETTAGRNAKAFFFTTFSDLTPESLFYTSIWYRGGDHQPRPLFTLPS